MSRVALLPRLTALGVSTLLDVSTSGPMVGSASRELLDERSSMLSYAASGGSRSEELGTELGGQLREIAVLAGFPDNSSQVARSKFDHEAAAYLGSHQGLASGEALRDDVWSYLATVVAPDVVAWRFPDRAVHRFEGGVRNAFQRLWTRGTVMDRGPDHADRWGLIRRLSEDASVQIFERASLGGNPPLAIALAEGWVRKSNQIGRAAMESVMRRVTKLIRLRNEVIDLASLSKLELDSVVSETFDLAHPGFLVVSEATSALA